MGFASDSAVKNPPHAGDMETQVQSLGRKNFLEEVMATHSSSFAGKFHGQRSPAGYSPWGHKELDLSD